MMRAPSRLTARLAVALAACALAACADLSSGPTDATIQPRAAATGELPMWTTVDDPRLTTDWTIWYRRTWVCKVGATATLAVAVNDGAPVSHTLNDGQCKVVYTWDHADNEIVDAVTVSELPSPGYQLDSIIKDSTHSATLVRLPTITGTSVVTVTATRSKNALLYFYNSEEPPAGGKGCTPGYWKQLQHFDSWTAPYTPNTLFSDVFDDAFPGMTLLQVLSQGGGGLTALGRHTIAALLNAASAGVSFGYSSPQEVIDAFNAAYPGSDYETLKDILAAANEQGCPLS